MKRLFLKLSLLILLITPLSALALDYHDAQVADISDRSYEPALIELLDNAKESILISMYVISAKTAPVKLLLNDLAEALEREVTVEIYLNTRYASDDHFKLTKDLKDLEAKGARIYLASSHHLLHDKLIIVDKRFVVEGSTNWSVSALKNNYESATIIDSPELAETKLIRIRNILLKGMEGEKDSTDRIDRPKVISLLPEAIEIPLILLEDKKYFPTMRKYGDNRSISAYLLLIAESARIGENEFFLDLEDFADLLMMPETWKATAKRRQVIKTLKKLSNKYKLITATFTHGKDTHITLTNLPGPAFTAPSGIFTPETLTKTSPTAKTVLLINLTEKDYSEKDLKALFHITPRQYKRGERALERVE